MAAAAPPKPPPRTTPASPPASANGNHTTAPAKGLTLEMVPSFAEPERLGLNAVEGWGKSTLAAHMPKPVILMSKGETGYRTLLSRKLVPQCTGALVNTWAETLGFVDHLIENDTGHESVAFDAIGGFERLCHEHVCARDFGGDWGPRGFTNYQKGPEVAVNDWLQLLSRLDRLREVRNMKVLLLGHVKIKTFKNPLGEDFDRYIVNCTEKTWDVTHKWLDAVFFGNFVTIVDKENKTAKKGKGIGGQDRVIYTQRHAAFDAKNRFGMPESIDIPNDPSATWSTLYSFIEGAQQS